MVKLIAFDLDGVLVEAKHIHFEALNIALSEVGNEYIITEQEHLGLFDGLKTNQKLDILSSKKKLPREKHTQIWNRKQQITLEKILNLKINEELVYFFKKLKEKNFLIACCSNSIRKSVFVMLSKIGIIEYFDLILSNEDVKNSKPHPEIYWRAMSELSVLPEETLIVEDSPHGLLSAYRSKANILRIKNPKKI